MKKEKELALSKIIAIIVIVLVATLFIATIGTKVYNEVARATAKANARACYSQISAFAYANEKDTDNSDILVDANCRFTGTFNGENYKSISFDQVIMIRDDSDQFIMKDLANATLTYLKDGNKFIAQYDVKTGTYTFDIQE